MDIWSYLCILAVKVSNCLISNVGYVRGREPFPLVLLRRSRYFSEIVFLRQNASLKFHSTPNCRVEISQHRHYVCLEIYQPKYPDPSIAWHHFEDLYIHPCHPKQVHSPETIGGCNCWSLGNVKKNTSGNPPFPPVYLSGVGLGDFPMPRKCLV